MVPTDSVKSREAVAICHSDHRYADTFLQSVEITLDFHQASTRIAARRS